MSENNDFVSFLAGMVIGGLVGAAAAMLLAPQSGEETRALIRDKGIELKDKAVDVGQDMQLRAEKALETTRVQLEDVVDELKSRTDELAKLVAKETSKLTSQAAPAAPATPAAKAKS